MSVIKLTYDDFDQRLEEMTHLNIQTTYPDLQEIDWMQEKVDELTAKIQKARGDKLEALKNERLDTILYAVYLYECGAKPSNQREKYSRRNLFDFINTNLELYDAEDGDVQ